MKLGCCCCLHWFLLLLFSAKLALWLLKGTFSLEPAPHFPLIFAFWFLWQRLATQMARTATMLIVGIVLKAADCTFPVSSEVLSHWFFVVVLVPSRIRYDLLRFILPLAVFCV